MEIEKMIHTLTEALADVERIETHGTRSCVHVVTAAERIRGVIGELEQMRKEQKADEDSGDEVPA